MCKHVSRKIREDNGMQTSGVGSSSEEDVEDDAADVDNAVKTKYVHPADITRCTCSSRSVYPVSAYVCVCACVHARAGMCVEHFLPLGYVVRSSVDYTTHVSPSNAPLKGFCPSLLFLVHHPLIFWGYPVLCALTVFRQ